MQREDFEPENRPPTRAELFIAVGVLGVVSIILTVAAVLLALSPGVTTPLLVFPVVGVDMFTLGAMGLGIAILNGEGMK